VRHNHIIRGIIICMVVLALFLAYLLIQPVEAEEIEPIPPKIRCTEPIRQEKTELWRSDVPLTAELQTALLAVCSERGVDPLLALGLIETESNFQTDIVSPWGDYGLCQLNCLYFDSANMTPAENMAAGVGLLAANIERYGTVEAALTAYNRGHDDGTRFYAATVLRNAAKWGYAQ